MLNKKGRRNQIIPPSLGTFHPSRPHTSIMFTQTSCTLQIVMTYTMPR